MEQNKRPGGRSARVRRAVLDAALAVLAGAGWASTTVDRIAERSGVHKTTIYRRWGSAEAVLLDALLDRGSTGIPVPDSGELRSDLFELGRSIAAVISDPVGRAVASAAISEPESEWIRRFAESFWSERLTDAGIVVRRAIERGEIPEGADPEWMIERLASSIWFRVMVRRRHVAEDWLASIIDSVVGVPAGRPVG